MSAITRREIREIIESKLTEKAAVREAFRRGFARGVAQERSSSEEPK